MPIYEYECEKCGHQFEREQRMTAPPVKSCPECKSRKVNKLISRSSFVLKGGGWYADGYSGASEEKDSPSDKSNENSSSSEKSDASSESEKKSPDSSTKDKKGNGGDTEEKKKKKKPKQSTA